MYYCYKYFVLFIIFSFTKSQVYDSNEAMQTLLVTQREIVKNLEEYLAKERFLFDTVEKYKAQLETEHEAGAYDLREYLDNPLNRWKLIYRMSLLSGVIVKAINVKTGFKWDSGLVYPLNVDVQGAFMGIIRLQETYRLSVSDLANGTLRGHFSEDGKAFVEHVSPMAAVDCFAFGVAPFDNYSYTLETQVDWLKEALVRYRENPFQVFDKKDILEVIAKYYFDIGDFKKNIEYLKKIIALYPKHEKNKDRKNFIGELEELMGSGRLRAKFEHKKPKLDKWKLAACYDDLQIRRQPNNFHCIPMVHHETYSVLKIEVLFRAPNIMIIHDFLRDFEARELIEIARSGQMETTAIIRHVEARTKVLKSPLERQAKMLTLNEKLPIVSRILKRISSYTALEFKTASAMQVITYGIGGSYVAHYDNYGDFGETVDNRTTTVLIFLSDVEQGGALVFNKLGIKIYPKKGAAVVFDVAYPSGDKNLEAMHTACPVLRGSKWIAIKWAVKNDQSSCLTWFQGNRMMNEAMYKEFVRSKYKEFLFEKYNPF